MMCSPVGAPRRRRRRPALRPRITCPLAARAAMIVGVVDHRPGAVGTFWPAAALKSGELDRVDYRTPIRSGACDSCVALLQEWPLLPRASR